MAKPSQESSRHIGRDAIVSGRPDGDHLATFVSRLSLAFAPRYLSLGLIWGWMSCAWNIGAFSPERTGASILFDQAWLPSAVFVVIGLLGLPLVMVHAMARFASDNRTASRNAPRVGTTVTSTVLLVAGTALTFAYAGSASVIMWLLGVCTGLGSAGLILGSSDVLSEVSTDQLELSMPANAVISGICMLMTPRMDPMLAASCACAMPLFAGIFLLIALSSSPHRPYVRAGATDEEGPSCDGEADKHTSGIPGDGVSVFVLLGSLTNFIAFFSICYLEVSMPLPWLEDMDILVSLATSALSVVLVVLVIGNSVRVDTRSLYRWVMPLLICAFALAMLGGKAPSGAACIIAEIADFSLMVLLGVYFITLAHRGQMSGCVAGGLCYGSCQLGVLLGNLLVAMRPNDVSAADWNLPCMVGCICLLALACALLPWLSDRQSAKHPGQRESPSSFMTGTPPNSMATTSAAIALRQEHALDEACAQVATVCGLSVRELDVLRYLARGRTQPYIREELLLSKNTVSSHVQHIYVKLGVHSKQELIDMIEATMQRDE